MFAELGALSNFTFLEGASHPHELVAAARALGMPAIGIADRNSVAGLVRGMVAAERAGIRFVPGIRLGLEDGADYLAWPADRAAWGRLCRMLSAARMEGAKGETRLTREMLLAHAEGSVLAAIPPACLDGAPSLAPSDGPPQAAPPGTMPRPARRDGTVLPACPEHTMPAARPGGMPQSARPESMLRPTRRDDTVRPARPGGVLQPTRPGGMLQPTRPESMLQPARPGGMLQPARPGGMLQPARPGGMLQPARPGGATLAAFAARLRSDADALRPRLALPLFCAVDHRSRGDDQARLDRLAAIGLPLIAAGGVRYHHPARRRLADVLAAIRLGTTVDALGYAAEPNAEAQLLAPAEVARRLPRHPGALAATLRVVETCRFSLRELSYEYPDEILDPGLTPQQTLERRVAAACAERWPGGVPDRVARQVAHELRLIAQMDYAAYFLTVHEIVRFARARGILCQGRGSAANSAVCYALGITAVAPDKHDLLFERFVSAARDEPPDIDVDFEHERREEVIQHIFSRYGRDRAAIAATLIRYRERSAIREVGKAFGLSEDVTARIAKSVWGAGEATMTELAAAQGLKPEEDPRIRMAMEIAEEIQDFPRHLATHVGGFVITRGPLVEHTVVVRAAMEGRTTLEWDKDDIEALRILKVDVLGLGMLTCIRRAFGLIEGAGGPALTLATVPQDDPATYAMLARADSLGVFQVESRAQMNMLPRLRPRAFYDLVIQVAIVRPGPIQGDMVHPYLRRRAGEEKVEIPRGLEGVLAKTLGVPLFQEQAMRIAIVGAGFSPARADELRRAMATFRHTGEIGRFRAEFLAGMAANGYDADFAARCFRQLEGFGTYGFPESHAASFAGLVYVSAWIKRHHPAAFAAALLNSQPMGFYAPAQIVRDAAEHGVAVRPVDVTVSGWDCALEGEAPGPPLGPVTAPAQPALRLGLRLVAGLKRQDAEAVAAARAAAPFRDIADLARRARLDRGAMAALARADALRGLAGGRRAALWDAAGVEAPPPLADAAGAESPPLLPPETAGEATVLDYAATGLSLRRHPLALLRPELAARGAADSRALAAARQGRWIRLAGLVLVRQRPGSAKGVVFFTVEDEWGTANLVLYPDIAARDRAAVVGARLVLAEGRVERTETAEVPILHLVVRRLHDWSGLLDGLHRLEAEAAPAFGRVLAPADEVRSPTPHDPRDRGARGPVAVPCAPPPIPGARPPPEPGLPVPSEAMPRSRDFR